MTAAVSPSTDLTDATPVPFVDLAGQDAEVRAEVEAGFRRVMDSTAFIQGPDVEQFEAAYARWSGIDHCIGAANGTDALELALRAAGIGPGDEVLLPANSFVATAEAVVRAGAEPCFVDVDPVHHLIAPEAAAARVTPRTRALLPVHLYGQMAPMAPLRSIADANDLLIIEDAAQAQGATQSGAGPGAAVRRCCHQLLSRQEPRRLRRCRRGADRRCRGGGAHPLPRQPRQRSPLRARPRSGGTPDSTLCRPSS